MEPEIALQRGVSANAAQREVSTTGASPKSSGFLAVREGYPLHPARLGVPDLAPLLIVITVGGEVGGVKKRGVLRRPQKGVPVLALPPLREAAAEPLSGSLIKKARYF